MFFVLFIMFVMSDVDYNFLVSEEMIFYEYIYFENKDFYLCWK